MKGRVVFITTKNLDYIRNVQEIRLLQERYSQCRVIGSASSNYFCRLLSVYLQVLFLNTSRYELVWIGFAPQLIWPLFWKFKGKKVVVDFFISLYDTFCNDRKKVRPYTLPGRLLHKLDQKTLEAADYIICDTKAHGEYFRSEFGIPNKPCFTLYLEADTSLFYPRSIERPKELKEKKIVLYFGSILPLQGVDIVLEAVSLLKQEENLYFFLIGPMDKDMRRWRPVGENIVYIDWLRSRELAEYIAMADICLAGHFSAKIEKASRTIPGKAYIYQAMKRKIILGDNRANRELFREGEENTFVRMGDAKALTEAIIKLAKD